MERLQQWKDTGRPIGFSPWSDADGMVWGVVLNCTPTRFTVRLISPLGQEEETESYSYRKISYFDEDPLYSERLVRLGGFVATLPDVLAWDKNRGRIKEILREAAQARELIRVRLKSEGFSRTMRVQACDGTWVEFGELDDLARPISTEIWKVSGVMQVQWRTAHEEADLFLLRGISI